MSDPNTDPHTFEASPTVAQEVSRAQLVVQNGVGYDDFMSKIESASSDDKRKVIDVQQLEHLPDSTPNPHLWYKPTTMPLVAEGAGRRPVGAAAGSRRVLQGQRRPLRREPCSRGRRRCTRFAAAHPGAAVATTEPVADYMLQAAGVDNLTPFSMQADIMNGTDPAPQAVSLQNALFSGHRVKAFVYNQQVTDSVTAGVPQARPRGRDAGRRGVRDDADPRLRLPVLDDGRAAGAAAGGRRREVDDEAVSTTTEPRPTGAPARRSSRSAASARVSAAGRC